MAALDHVFAALDPKSLILSQFSNKPNNDVLQLTTTTTTTTTESFVLERGPRYNAYAELRESKLRLRNIKQQEQQLYEDYEFNPSPLPPTAKKQVKFQGSFPATTATHNGRKGGSVLAQSVPDFSAALRKENRRPAAAAAASALPPTMEKSRTPPPTAAKKLNGAKLSGGGSRSANSAAEKRGGGGGGLMAARKSYASVEELKGLSMAASNAIINGENRGTTRVTTRAGGRATVLGYRQF